MTVIIKITIFFDVMTCSLVEMCRRFGTMHCLILQCQKLSQASNEPWLLLTGCFLGLDSENGGSTFLRNVGNLQLGHIISQHR